MELDVREVPVVASGLEEPKAKIGVLVSPLDKVRR
jgi:hypothetical protein